MSHARLDRKLVRDLWQMRGQAVAVGLVIACGAATFVMSLSTLDSLEGAREAYYDRYRFADLFAHVKRAQMDLPVGWRTCPVYRSSRRGLSLRSRWTCLA